jgi:hypothetical protein
MALPPEPAATVKVTEETPAGTFQVGSAPVPVKVTVHTPAGQATGVAADAICGALNAQQPAEERLRTARMAAPRRSLFPDTDARALRLGLIILGSEARKGAISRFSEIGNADSVIAGVHMPDRTTGYFVGTSFVGR